MLVWIRNIVRYFYKVSLATFAMVTTEYYSIVQIHTISSIVRDLPITKKKSIDNKAVITMLSNIFESSIGLYENILIYKVVGESTYMQ